MNGFKLKLTYENHEVRVFDVTPYISGSWYSELKNESNFRSVKAQPDSVGIEWLNGQDIAPHELYEMSVKV